ncbi:hypothetical protein [Kitasatospora cathayae]|uniref:Uncharacterized protein n=1 Tax=Kitasatospora cathayae TaxID=3004092 RepID=A0ABY7QHI5_9ACTN|nr:hypothetical protein [Kitasatospora sp. HUAS 3-15]WBP92002.1 hypothetical protein O1G21_40155 [Kitasatospora sp. HUAS 3-15]
MHVRMVLNHHRPVELGPELVQSTGQSFQVMWLFVAALIIAAA